MATATLTGGTSKRVRHDDLRGGTNFQTIGATLTLPNECPTCQVIVCTGSGQTVNLPLETDSEGKLIAMFNASASALSITVKDNASAVTIGTIAQNKAALFMCVSGVWRALVGA